MIDSFDPFSDRLARNIRNRLSKAFVRSVHKGDPTDMDHCIDNWLHRDISPGCRAYIEERRQRYRHVLKKLQSEGARDALHQSIPIFNSRLFFEFHEYVEGLWKESREENQRQALKAMVMAAGAYEHFTYQNTTPARRLAQRAADLLARYGRAISFCKNLDELISALRRGDDIPPLLIPA